MKYKKNECSKLKTRKKNEGRKKSKKTLTDKKLTECKKRKIFDNEKLKRCKEKLKKTEIRNIKENQISEKSDNCNSVWIISRLS